MYSAHGWATIWPSFKNDTEVDDLLDGMDALRDRIADRIRRLGLDRAGHANPFAEVRDMNYEMHFWLSGNNNHGQWHETILDLYRFIAEVAPGSYGVLYIEDDEDATHQNQFQVWVLARGNLAERVDPFLSPRIPTVEAPFKS